MLPYILAIAVALASFILLVGAFTFPKLHRQDDFLWSGIGLFYALVLWVCAGRLTGGVLLGQAAATLLLLAFGWQTLKLRRALAYPGSQTDLEGFSLTRWLGNFRKTSRQPAAAPKPPAAATEVTEAQVTEIATEMLETATTAASGAAIELEKASEQIQEEIGGIVEEASPVAEEEIGGIVEEASPVAEESMAAEIEPPTQEKPGFFPNISPPHSGKTEANPNSLTAALDAIETDSDFEEFDEDWQPEEVDAETVSIPETENLEPVAAESLPEESESENPFPAAVSASETAIEVASSEAATEANLEESGEDWQQ